MEYTGSAGFGNHIRPDWSTMVAGSTRTCRIHPTKVSRPTSRETHRPCPFGTTPPSGARRLDHYIILARQWQPSKNNPPIRSTIQKTLAKSKDTCTMHSMMNKLSKTSKLGTKSWSLQAGIPADGGTCSGALSEDGGYVAACSGCYAREIGRAHV